MPGPPAFVYPKPGAVKVCGNVDALKLLNQPRQEGRSATPDERRRTVSTFNRSPSLVRVFVSAEAERALRGDGWAEPAGTSRRALLPYAGRAMRYGDGCPLKRIPLTSRP
jgi:hypothetical protein